MLHHVFNQPAITATHAPTDGSDDSRRDGRLQTDSAVLGDHHLAGAEIV